MRLVLHRKVNPSRRSVYNRATEEVISVTAISSAEVSSSSAAWGPRDVGSRASGMLSEPRRGGVEAARPRDGLGLGLLHTLPNRLCPRVAASLCAGATRRQQQ